MNFLKTRSASTVAAMLLMASATPTFAHHGWSDYDADARLTLKGIVKASSYENPHASITLNADSRTYTVILAPVSRMEGRGASREALAVGKEVTVIGYPSRTRPGEVRAERIQFREADADKTVELR